MNWEQRKLKKDIQLYRNTCKEHYHISRERKCEGCPYEYLSDSNNSGCKIVLIFRKLNSLVPSYWSNTAIEDIFKE